METFVIALIMSNISKNFQPLLYPSILIIFVMYNAFADPTIITIKPLYIMTSALNVLFALLIYSSKLLLFSLSSNFRISNVKKYNEPQIIMDAVACTRFKLVSGKIGVLSIIDNRQASEMHQAALSKVNLTRIKMYNSRRRVRPNKVIERVALKS